MTKTFTCSVCKSTFKTNRTNEEALAIKEQIWGDCPIEQCSVVCSCCYEQVMAWYKSKEGNA
jgi:hypothetical protein